MQLNAVGQMICREWQALPGRFPGLELYAFVIMPNHVHGIILLNPIDDAAIDRTSEHYQVFSKPTAVDENTGAAREDQLPRVTPGSLGAIIRAFKSSTSMRFHRMRDGDPGPLWQRNYYDRIIRNMREFEMIRAYILANPTTWENDQANPNNCYP